MEFLSKKCWLTTSMKINMFSNLGIRRWNPEGEILKMGNSMIDTKKNLVMENWVMS